jgi:predicted aldo/keto reductase-like oxidoreductase
LLAGYFLFGALLYRVPVGLDASAFWLGETLQEWVPFEHAVAGIIWLAAGALTLLVGVFLAVRRAVRRRVDEVDPGRRSFLTGTGLGAGAALGSVAVAAGTAAMRALYGMGQPNDGWLGVQQKVSTRAVPFTHPEAVDEWRGSRIESHRRFGRTEFQVSDIVLGTGRIQGQHAVDIARKAIERGVNYLDTSPDYSGSGSEHAMGEAMKGVRDDIFVATKFCTPVGHLPAGTPVARYMEAIDDSLGRLQTDRVELIHIHSCDDVDRLMDENVHEAFDRLKEQGKARFLGFSTHTPNLLQVANTAIDSGRFDVMMLAYHHGLWPEIGDAIHRARAEQDMGIVAMKTLKGAKHRNLVDFEPYADAYSQAALRWVLSNRDVSCAVISFFELQHIDEYLHASGKPFGGEELALLQEYDRQIVGSYCAPHCGKCLDACPEDVPIHDVLRHRMYFEDYGWEKEGMQRYAALQHDASVCASCPAPCLGACPVGISIPDRMREAHDLLTLG